MKGCAIATPAQSRLGKLGDLFGPQRFARHTHASPARYGEDVLTMLPVLRLATSRTLWMPASATL